MADSGVFAPLIIATLFSCHNQHRSDIGLHNSDVGHRHQSEQNVVYAAALMLASSSNSLYSAHTAYNVSEHYAVTHPMHATCMHATCTRGVYCIVEYFVGTNFCMLEELDHTNAAHLLSR